MSTTLVIVIAIAVVVLLVLGWLGYRASRRRRLRSRFGPEYERTVGERGNTRRAERDLLERAEARDQLELRELTPNERDRYRGEWDAVQASFVDRPAVAVHDADRLVGAVMRDRGYPVEDFEQQADLVSVDHPRVVEHYRAAHTIAERSGRGDSVSTEDQRNAFVHYRELFDELLTAHGDEPRHRDDDRDRDDAPSEHHASARSDDGRR